MSHAVTCTGTTDEPSQDEGKPAVGGLKTDVDDVHTAITPARPKQTPESQAEEGVLAPWWTHQKKQGLCPSIDNPIPFSSEPLPGLHLFHDFITEEEEEQILAELDGTSHHEGFLPWKFARFNGPHKGKRWGVHCNLRDRRVGAAENPLPPFVVTILLPKLQRVPQMIGCSPNEANAIDYSHKAGDYLTGHVDDRQLSKEPIANLSLAGDCYMTFANQKAKGRSEEPSRILLPRRTLQVITGKARYEYSHGIRNQDLLSERRVSVTLRESPPTK